MKRSVKKTGGRDSFYLSPSNSDPSLTLKHKTDIMTDRLTGTKHRVFCPGFGFFHINNLHPSLKLPQPIQTATMLNGAAYRKPLPHVQASAFPHDNTQKDISLTSENEATDFPETWACPLGCVICSHFKRSSLLLQ